MKKRFALGAVLFYVFGVFTAPKTGKESREVIKSKSTKVIGEAKKYTRKATCKKECNVSNCECIDEKERLRYMEENCDREMVCDEKNCTCDPKK